MIIKRKQQRNIKRTSQAKNTTLNIANTPRMLKSTGLSKYKFPMCDEVPPGNYFSKVTSAKYTITSSGKDAVEVLYELKDGITCYNIANGKLPKNTKIKSFYIKQTYPLGTQFCDAFIDSMAEALGVEEFEPQKTIGVTEYVALAYDKNDIGGFIDRSPFEFEDFVQVNSDDNNDVVDYDYSEYDY